MSKPRKPASDSTQGRVLEFKQADQTYELPSCCHPLSEEEKPYWEAYVSGKSEWTPALLIELRTLVALTVEARQIHEQCKATPLIYTNGSGSPMEHPIHRIARDHEKLIHRQIRICGLQAPYPRSSVTPPGKPPQRGKRKGYNLLG